ncbi:MAG: TetR/AcrR family transcriptional regulator [Paracoccaceae bacterium]
MSRNKDETRQRILDAALALAGEEGFAALGINAVARRAGADKQLIYRYFGGLEGLLAAAGADVAARMAAALTPALVAPPDSYAELAERLALALYDQMCADSMYRQLRLMEASAPSPATDAFRAARGAALQAWVVAARQGLAVPKGVDVPALNAVIIAAVEGATILGPVGMERGSDAARARLIPVLRGLIRAGYAVGAE